MAEAPVSAARAMPVAGAEPSESAVTSDADAAPPANRTRLASLFTSDPTKEELKPIARPVETMNECLVAEICIDDYLWALYERTPKIDTVKVPEKTKVQVKKKGKVRTVTKITYKYVTGDFGWKDPIAAQRMGMSLEDYVIGGMDPEFKNKLYRALRAIDDAGFMPGITSAFRDDYRQAIASGLKAASDSSYHGGSRRGGYGHGLAADIVSVRGDSRMQRYISSEEMWKWVDAHEKELGIGRPYLDHDPPHVGPLDGREYADKRGRANVRRAALQKKMAQKLAMKTNAARAAARSKAAKMAPSKTAQAIPAQRAVALPQAAQKTAAPAKIARKPALSVRLAQKAKPVVTRKPPLAGRNVAVVAKRPKPVVRGSKVSSLELRPKSAERTGGQR